MAKKIIWTLSAHQEVKDILDYRTFRNQSISFKVKLNDRIEQAIQYISKHFEAGRVTNIPQIRTLIVYHYLIIYEIINSDLYVLSIWDGRQHPAKLKSDFLEGWDKMSS